MKTLQVRLPQGAYTIHMGANILDRLLPQVITPVARELVLVVTNDTLDSLYPGRVARALAPTGLRVETCVLPDGERYKTLETLGRIFDRLMALGANRQTVLVAFGGGVVGDMTGFAAASFMRGIPFVQVPTTLLAGVDSSIGGKTGVNHPLGKNAIGAFKQPAAVVLDLELLATLPQRELRAGLFELIKHGLIQDAPLLDFLAANAGKLNSQDWAFWEEALCRSCAVKARVVEQDEKEEHIRAILNFGHSLGHLIETHTHYETYLHGEAVGVGMLFAGYLSTQWGHLPPGEFDRLCDLLLPLLMPMALPPLDEATFSALLLHDKKTAQGGLKYILLEHLGQAFIRPNTTPAEIWPVFQQFLARFPQVCHLS